MKFRATVAIFLPLSSPASRRGCHRRREPSFHSDLRTKYTQQPAAPIEKARRPNTVKATIIVGDIENFSSLTAMYIETELYNISCTSPRSTLLFPFCRPAVFLCLLFFFFFFFFIRCLRKRFTPTDKPSIRTALRIGPENIPSPARPLKYSNE